MIGMIYEICIVLEIKSDLKQNGTHTPCLPTQEYCEIGRPTLRPNKEAVFSKPFETSRVKCSQVSLSSLSPGRQRQEDFRSKANLGNSMRLYLRQANNLSSNFKERGFPKTIWSILSEILKIMLKYNLKIAHRWW